MGSNLYITNHSSLGLSVELVRQGPVHSFDHKVELATHFVNAGRKRANVVHIDRGLILVGGDAIETFEIQMRIHGRFVGAVVIMLDGRSQPWKNEMFWALRSAGATLTRFVNDKSTQTLSYQTFGFDVTAKIAGEPHGLGFYDIVVTFEAVAMKARDIDIDLSLKSLTGTEQDYQLSMTRGHFALESVNGQLSEIQTSMIVQDGAPVRLKAQTLPGALLTIATSSGILSEIPVDQVGEELLTLTVHAAPLAGINTHARPTITPITLVSDPVSTRPPGGTSPIPADYTYEQWIDLSKPDHRQWAIDAFGGMLAYVAENRQYLWNGFAIFDPNTGGINPRVVTARVVSAQGVPRVVFAGYHRNFNTVFNRGFFGTGKNKFIALFNGYGTLAGAQEAISAGVVPEVPSMILFGVSVAHKIYSSLSEEDVSAGQLLSIPIGEYLQNQVTNGIAVALTSGVMYMLWGNPRQARGPRVPVVVLVAINYASNLLATYIVDYVTDWED